MSRVKINRRVYLTEDGERAVEPGDPDAAVLLCAEGGEVDLAEAARYGLLDAPGPEEDSPGPEGDAAKPEEDAPVKAARRPPNKARRAAANKSAAKTGDAADESKEGGS